MSSETVSSVRGDRATLWAGRVLVGLGVLHLLVTGWLSRGYIGGWLGGSAWFPPGGLATSSPEVSAFWLTAGSFAVPQVLLGALVAKRGAAGEAVPRYVGWVLVVWGVWCAAVFEPSPFVAAVVPAAMLILGARRESGAGDPR
jgi:hypothetical protein